jgi:hypothetical protein
MAKLLVVNARDPTGALKALCDGGTTIGESSCVSCLLGELSGTWT